MGGKVRDPWPRQCAIHRIPLPGHPARWLLTSMAGLLTRGSGLAPPSHAHRNLGSGHSGSGGHSPLTVAGAVTDLAAVAYTTPYSLFTRPRVVWPGTITVSCATEYRPDQGGKRQVRRCCRQSVGRNPSPFSSAQLSPRGAHEPAGWRGTRQRRDKRLAHKRPISRPPGQRGTAGPEGQTAGAKDRRGERPPISAVRGCAMSRVIASSGSGA